MNIKMLKAAVAGLVLSVSAFANAGLIDFNTISDGAYSGNSDFNVTTYGGPESDLSLIPVINGQYLCNSSEILDTSCDYPTENFIDFDFFLGIDSISVVMNWAGDPADYGTGALITSYDINGSVLESFGYQSGSTYTFNSSADIWRLTTDSGRQSTSVGDDPSWWYGIESINYAVGSETRAEVPEPSTLAIFALGIMGLASRRFKKQ